MFKKVTKIRKIDSEEHLLNHMDFECWYYLKHCIADTLKWIEDVSGHGRGSSFQLSFSANETEKLLALNKENFTSI